ncbi:uncharacterized protein LOC128491260 [Spea bombifrons]|uniref:uncharacterized protein LOC128491260 n=1 Tax=Spea bombifrons TaxID=233779 RepID=UPI0023491CAB|nr:uncharacterized protein LOC128491260 [Spea bombifrons]
MSREVTPPSPSSSRPSQCPPQEQVLGGISGHLPQGVCRKCAKYRDMIGQLQQEKEEALQDQRRAFQDQLSEIAKNRRHLEEERAALLRHRLEQEMKEKAQVLHQNWKEDTDEAIQKACEEARREAEREREREIQLVKEAAEIEFKERLQEAEHLVKEKEQKRFEIERQELETKHSEELRAVHVKVCTVQEQLKDVIREKMDFENKFKELQLNYKRFIDLTDSALHSDYLLHLIRLGRPPGFAHGAVQTDDVINTPL